MTADLQPLVHYIVDAPELGHTVWQCAVCPITAIAGSDDLAKALMVDHWETMATQADPDHKDLIR